MRSLSSTRRAVLGALALCVLAPALLLSQPPRERGTGSGAFFFTIGAQQLDLDDLNPALEAADYPRFSDTALGFGVFGYRAIRRVVLGFDAQGLVVPDETTTDDRIRTELSGGSIHFDVGYQMVSTPRLHLYPLLGLGVGATTLRFVERGTPTFGEILEQPLRSSELSQTAFMLDGALGLDYYLPWPGGRGRPGGLALGLRGGYTVAPFVDDWRMEETDAVSGGPEARIQGPYVRLMIGSWRGPSWRR